MALKTKRLTLRSWTDEDLEPYAQMNTDLPVSEFSPVLLSRQESDGFVKLISDHIKRSRWQKLADISHEKVCI